VKIALEVTSACRPNRGGIGRYIQRMVPAMLSAAPEHEYRLLDRLSRWRNRSHRLVVPGTRHSWIQGRVWPPDRRADIVHGLDARVPAWPRVPSIATLHDVFSLHLEHISPPGFVSRARKRYTELSERCERLIAVSETTRQRFLEHVPFDPERIDVVHLGVDPAFHVEATPEGERQLARRGIGAPYLLYVGELSARKNLPRMLAAYASSTARASHRVVLAGAASYGTEEVDEAIEQLGIGERVIRAGYVPDELLPQLYAHGDALLFATLYEGFGLPALEALAAGLPVVGGDVGAVPEVCAGHAELVAPCDIDAIRAGIEAALGWNAERRRAGQAHARSLTWERCARGTLAVYARCRAALGSAN
jgi:glycosyltransferase involved in cell wall biosynthesis